MSEAGLGTAMLGAQWEHLHQPQTPQIAPKAGPRCWAHGLLAVLWLGTACPLPVHLGEPGSLGTAWAGANRDGAQRASSRRTWLHLSQASLFGGNWNYSGTHHHGLALAPNLGRRERARDSTAVGCSPLPGVAHTESPGLLRRGRVSRAASASGAGGTLAPLAQGLAHSEQRRGSWCLAGAAHPLAWFLGGCLALQWVSHSRQGGEGPAGRGYGCSLAATGLVVPEQAASAGEVYSKGKNKLLIMRAAPAGLSGPHGLMNIQHRAEH